MKKMFYILLISIFIAANPVLGAQPVEPQEQESDGEQEFGLILTEDKILNDTYTWARKHVRENQDSDFTFEDFYKFISATDRHLKIANEYFTQNPEKKPVQYNIDVDQFKTLIRLFSIEAYMAPVLFVCQLITELNKKLGGYCFLSNPGIR